VPAQGPEFKHLVDPLSPLPNKKKIHTINKESKCKENTNINWKYKRYVNKVLEPFLYKQTGLNHWESWLMAGAV
jgi:hypothetical protein